MTHAPNPSEPGKKPPLSSRFKAWWNGQESEPAPAEPPPAATEAPASPAAHAAPAGPAQGMGKNGRPLWSATRIDVAEKMWGKGYILPGGEAAVNDIAKPLGLSTGRRVLNLGCGLGGAAQFLARKYAVAVDCRDFSPALVKIAGDRIAEDDLASLVTVGLFDPNNLSADGAYDCIFSQDTTICAFAQERLFEELTAGLAPGGRLMVVDYFLDDDADAGAPALGRWREAEPLEMRTIPVSEQQERLTRSGLDIRIVEDRTASTMTQVNKALAALNRFLQEVELPPETRSAIAAEINLWDARSAAIGAGLRYYMYQAGKPD